MFAPNVALQVAVAAAANQPHSGPPPPVLHGVVAIWVSGTILVVIGCLAVSLVAYLAPDSSSKGDARKARLVLLVSWAWPVIVVFFLMREVVMAIREVWGSGVAKWRAWFPHVEPTKPGPNQGAYRTKP